MPETDAYFMRILRRTGPGAVELPECAPLILYFCNSCGYVEMYAAKTVCPEQWGAPEPVTLKEPPG